MIDLKSALRSIPFHCDKSIEDMRINGVSFKSSQIKPGYAFVLAKPISGSVDLKPYIQEALHNGAVCLIKDKAIDLIDFPETTAVVIDVKDARAARARIAANLFPGQPETVVAITGTNGKTSVAYFLQQIWAINGKTSASMGTAGFYGNLDLTGLPENNLTSPNPLVLHKSLSLLKSRGCTHLSLEASSHGLDQGRLDCIDIAAGGYTNLTHEHLDYHKDMDQYFAAKARLFTDLLLGGSTAVINADDFRFPKLLSLCKEKGHRIISFGRQSNDIQLNNIDLNDSGQIIDLKIFAHHHRIKTPLIGAIQAYNLMCAIGLAIASGIDEADVIKAIPFIHSAPGRFDLVGRLKNGAKVFVDYAHTPDALQTLLTSMRPHVNGMIHLVFGCGGDRDKNKRPMMGEIADKMAERVYITDDNPRNEDSEKIRAQIMQKCPNAKEIPDRREAIKTAIAKCQNGDVCIIAGKGHEKGQIVKDVVWPFDDREIAKQEIMNLEGQIT